MGVPPMRVEGLADLRRGFKGISRSMVTELRKAEIEGAQVVAAEAARRAPRGTKPLPANRKKRLHESVRPLVRGTRIYVGATAKTAPHANVNHWGGEIKPKGTPIRFRRRPFVLEALAAKRPEFIAAFESALNDLFRRNGFH
jgi:hypothetical protein